MKFMSVLNVTIFQKKKKKNFYQQHAAAHYRYSPYLHVNIINMLRLNNGKKILGLQKNAFSAVELK